METALNDKSDGIMQPEKEVNSLESKSSVRSEENTELWATEEDLVSWSER